MARPHSFFTDFAGFGQAWVAPLGSSNEHLVRDVGGLYVALLAFSGWAAVKGDSGALRALGWAWLAFVLPHLALHATHWHGFSTVEWAASLTPLTFAALGAAMLALLRRDSTTRAGRPAARMKENR
jgi:hypothetical protein